MGVSLYFSTTGKDGKSSHTFPDSWDFKFIKMRENKFFSSETDLQTLTTKEVLTSVEAAKYMGISMSYLYKLTMRREIPHFKPMGKMCYFNRRELEEWLQSNRVSTDSELKEWAQTYCLKKGGVR